MMGITRYTRILALFDENRPSLTVAEMSEALETSASTLYRLVREMVAVEMLESTVESHYRLGPLFVEYYRRIVLTDPLIRSGTKFLEPLATQAGVACTAILARLYGKTVMCVAEHRMPAATFKTSYELGRPMPLLRGATSKAVLSSLPKRNITALLADKASEETREALAASFAAIRKFGFCETRSEVDRDLIGIAAPLRNAELGINASVSVIIEARSLTTETQPQIYTAVTATARMIEGFMAEQLG
ncbi:transcriptional regulator, IclR family [Kaistia soli DSM 19436]|uniref:Transcriptional regulator, IclR family n=1 Tax=Kaistia soli DSM 19436 TaxID=1122133 RepID=A0A1M5KLI7_9HYPH|nr:IclR family transcriptional regulator C-terminal domain-containing protein [Kaistia soli]SHG53601.1 transcriptional regulator, IclR family [Kaistia soli DSM 19436]